MAVLAAAARAINVPYPIVLVLGGGVSGCAVGLPETSSTRTSCCVIFLPPLLYAARSSRTCATCATKLRPISLLSIGLVLVTMVAVASVAHALIDGLSWPAAFVLGAIVGPTDPVAATAIARRLGVPRTDRVGPRGRVRWSTTRPRSSPTGSRIVATAGAVAFSLLDAGWEFLWKAAGGIAVGLVVGWVVAQVRRRLNDPLIENTIGLLTAYAAYVPAEQLHVSAVLAAVTVGCYVGWQAPKIASPATRLMGFGMWELLLFLLNAFLFILIGLQLPAILDAPRRDELGTLLGYAAAVSAAVVLTRLVWQHTIVFVDPRARPRARACARGARAGRRALIVGWAGMRGAVSLAAALALPADFPQRDLIVFLTFAVIFVTLVLQGLTLPPLIRALGVIDDGSDEEHEELKARLVATKAALARSRSSPARSGRATTRSSGCGAPTSTASAGWRRARARSRTTASRTARSVTRRSCARCWRRSARRSCGCATRARSPTTSCTGSSASSTSRTSGSRSER